MISDWGMEQEIDRLLPNSRKKSKPTISSLILKESREQDRISELGSKPRNLLPNLESREQKPDPDPIQTLLPNPESREQTISQNLLPNSESREQTITKSLPPNSEIREQLEGGKTIVGRSIVNVKGTNYILNHCKSAKTLPEHKGWLEIKPKSQKLYLYLRWRDGKTQRSQCMGKLDRLS